VINLSLVKIEFRAPKKHKQMIEDLARNRKLKQADVLREALVQYLSSYSTIPSLKELDRQVQNIQKDVDEIKKALVKKGIIE